jgi:hypothetical protein
MANFLIKKVLQTLENTQKMQKYFEALKYVLSFSLALLVVEY